MADIYIGEGRGPSFDGKGHVTISVEEFNQLVLAKMAADRFRKGLQRMSSIPDDYQMIILATWPWVLSNEEIAVAAKIIRGLTKIADNLLDGKTWNGKEEGLDD